MSDITDGDRVYLINEGSVFTDAGTLVRHGEPGVVIGHQGLNDLVVHWIAMRAYGVVPRQSVAVARR